MSFAVSPISQPKPTLYVYALGSGPSKELSLWLDHFDWQCSSSLNKVSRWLMAQAVPVLLIDLRVSPQRMLAETKYLTERFAGARFVVLIRPDQKHWGQEAVRLGVDFYISPEHCTGEGLSMLLDCERIGQISQPGLPAQLDNLTGLVNRPLCFDRLNHALALASRRNTLTGLLIIDVDRFEELNRHYGEVVADNILQLAAEKISLVMRSSDTLARTGGNQFTLIVEDLHDDAMLGHIAAKIHQQFAEPIQIEDQFIVVTLGIGGQLAKGGEVNADVLFRQASAALQRAKESGRKGLWFYSQSLNIKTIARSNMEQGLCKALEREEFMLQYQPIHLGSNGQFAGAEVVLRWRHPTAGMVPSDVFQPLLKSSGLINDVDRWMFEQVCRQLNAWEREQCWPESAQLMLPLCLKQIRNTDYASFIKETLTRYKIPAESLIFEVVEDIPMNYPDLLQRFVDQVGGASLAVKVTSLADRQMALTFLKKLNIKMLKIGQASIRNMDVDHMDAAVTRVVVEIAHIYGVEVLAQDVDSQYQIEKLKALGCDRFQGYVYSKPIEGEEWRHYLQACTC